MQKNALHWTAYAALRLPVLAALAFSRSFLLNEGVEMKFDMSVSDNAASFIDKETGDAVFVDSFDNKEFEVRIGTIESSEIAGTVTAVSDSELNEKLAELFKKFKEGQ